MTAPRIARIEVFAHWIGFYGQQAWKLTVTAQDDGGFRGIEEPSENVSMIRSNAIEALLRELNTHAPELDPAQFDISREVLDRHFHSLWTNDSPSLLVTTQFDDGTSLQCFSNSQHAFLLPFEIREAGEEPRKSFNPRLSEAISQLLPDEFVLKQRLSDGRETLRSELKRLQKDDEAFQARSQERDDSQTEKTDWESIEKRLENVLAEMHLKGRQAAEQSGQISQILLYNASLDETRDILERGGDPSVADDVGQTALMHAAFPPFDKVRFDLLVEAGADVNAACKDGITGLHLACAGGEVDAARAWIDAGADVNARTPDGETPLMLAGFSRSKITRMLLEAGADVNAVDHEGCSALYYLLESQSNYRVTGQLESLRLLLAAGIDLETTNQDGVTPIAYAEQMVRRRRTEHEVQAAIHSAMTGKPLPPPESARQTWERIKDQLSEADREMWVAMYDSDYDEIQFAEAMLETLKASR